MKRENIQKIVQDRNLQPFILGEGDFTNTHPGIDYSRWNMLQKYFESLEPNHPHRRVIRETILQLLSDDSREEAKYASLSVGRLLKLPEIINKIIDVVSSQRLNEFSIKIQNLILFSGTKLQLAEIGEQIVTIFLESGRLGEFLLSSATPPHIRDVKADDIWRLDFVGKVYEKSDETTRKTIATKIVETAGRDSNFRLAIEKYVSEKKHYINYSLLLRNLLSDYGENPAPVK